MKRRKIIFVLLTLLYSFGLTSQTTQETVSAWLKEKYNQSVNELNQSEKNLVSAKSALDQAIYAKQKAEELKDAESIPIADKAIETGKQNVKKAESAVSYNKAMAVRLKALLEISLPDKPSYALPGCIKGTVYKISGNKKILLDSKSVILPGEKIKTSDDGFLDLHFLDNSVVSVGPNSEFQLEEKTALQFIQKIIFGKAHYKHSPAQIIGTRADANTERRIKTVTAIAAVRGTEFDFSIDSNNVTRLIPYSGKMDLMADSSALTLMKINRWWENGKIKSSESKDEKMSGYVVDVKGIANISSAGKQSQALTNAIGLQTGDKITTTANSQVKLLMPGGGICSLNNNTEIEVGKTDTLGRVTFVVWSGMIHYDGSSLTKTNSNEPRFFTKNTASTGKDAEFIISVNKKSGLSEFIVLKKTISISAKDQLLDFNIIEKWWEKY